MSYSIPKTISMTENDCSVNFKLNYKLFIVLSVISLLILYSFYRIFKYIKNTVITMFNN